MAEDDLDFDPPESPPDAFARLGRTAKRRIAEAWFRRNFDRDRQPNWEDDDNDEDFELVISDFVDPADVLATHFEGALLDEDVEWIANRLRADSSTWSPAAARRRSAEPYEQPEEDAPAEQRVRELLGDRTPQDVIRRAHDLMTAALIELETAQDLVIPFSSRIGGNNPPEEIGVPPYSDEDAAEVQAAISTLKAQAAVDAAPPAEAAKAVQVLVEKQGRLGAYLAKMGDKAAMGFAEESGKSLGKAVGPGALVLAGWAMFQEALLNAAEAAGNWLEALRLFGGG